MAVYYENLIIGAGASGVALAIMLANQGKKVALLEYNDKILKKVSATGNGRCNLSNINVDESHYNCPDFVAYSLNNFDVSRCKRFFYDIGIQTKQEDDRIYPYSMSANSVINVLLDLLKIYNVQVFTSSEVKAIEKKKGSYFAICENGVFECKNLIFATGSNATCGKDSLTLLEPLGHNCTKKISSITQLVTNRFKGLAGVRVQVKLTLADDKNNIVFSKIGEALFKDNALSGIVAFEASCYFARALRENVNCKGIIDFVPEFSESQICQMLTINKTNILSAMCGLLQKSVAQFVLNSLKIKYDRQAVEVVKEVAKKLKHFETDFDCTGDIKNSQVVCGGLQLSQWDNTTMQSKLNKGLFAIGEALDVDGDCGGFNLHWAWASAHTCATKLLKD